MTRNVFLFGAGASFASDGVLPSPPPLGYQLFSELEKVSLTAQQLCEKNKKIFRNDFEKGMEFLIDSENRPIDVISKIFRDIARLLLQYEATPRSLYFRLMRQVRHSHNIFATLNYDLLLEDCANMFFQSNNSSRTHTNQFEILKLHGSCNYIPEGRIRGMKMNQVEKLGSTNIQVLNRPSAELWLSEDNDLMPDMRLYLPGKENLWTNSRSVGHYEDWKQSLTKATHIYLAGVRIDPADEHIWLPLIEVFEKVQYFGLEPDRPQFEVLNSRNGGKPAKFHATGFEGLLKHLEALPSIFVH